MIFTYQENMSFIKLYQSSKIWFINNKNRPILKQMWYVIFGVKFWYERFFCGPLLKKLIYDILLIITFVGYLQKKHCSKEKNFIFKFQIKMLFTFFVSTTKNSSCRRCLLCQIFFFFFCFLGLNYYFFSNEVGSTT